MTVGQRRLRLPAAMRPVGAMVRRAARHRHAPHTPSVLQLAREEWFLGVSVGASAIFLLFGDALFGALAGPAGMAAMFVILFAVILTSSLSVVRHADHLARQLGEPYGTLILTLSVAVIEVVSVSAVIVHGDNNPTLARDSLLSVVMIILNGMVGASLLIGAWLHREQHYNLQGANTYLAVIIPLVVLSLVLPCFTRTTPGPTLSLAQSVFLILTSVGLYGAFLGIQTGRHRGYFADDGEGEGEAAMVADEAGPARPPVVHAMLLAAYLAPVIVLAEQLARPVDYLIETLHAPVAIGGVALAALVAAPEAIGAVRGAFNNHLQRAVNIFLGSVLATIGLTVPAMLIISRLVGRSMILGVEGPDRVMLLLTLAVSMVTFSSGRTNVLQGAVHLVLFAAYLLLMFQG
jgi:Ca2+:H+ antiporter